MKNRKKIQFEFFVNKSLKIHNAKNICYRAFCLAPNESKISNLLTLTISLEATFAWWRFLTSSLENENPVSFEYVKKSKWLQLFSRLSNSVIHTGDSHSHELRDKTIENIKAIARRNHIQTGMMATGNYGRGILDEHVSNQIITELMPPVILSSL